MKYMALIYTSPASMTPPDSPEFGKMMDGYKIANETYHRDGVYVSGDAQISLSVSGNDQVVTITQGGQTSTITIDYDNNQTIFSSGGPSRTFGGVPMDVSLGQSQATPGVSLFVNGSVTSLFGGQS